MRIRKAGEPRIIKISANGRKETREILMDQTVLISAALASLRSLITENLHAWLDIARLAYAAGSEPVADVDYRHLAKVADILTGIRATAALRVRKQANLLGAEFAETFPREIAPSRAIAFLKNLRDVSREYWEFYMRQSQQSAFFIAGVENESILGVIKDAIAESLNQGQTLAQFEDAVRSKLSDLALTGGKLRNVWHSNVTNSYNNTRYEELEKPEVKEVLGYWLFDALVDNVTRINHAMLDNGVAPVDWPLWSRYKPMLGYNCRCAVIAITTGRAKAMLASGEAWDMTMGVPFGAGPDKGFVRMAA